MPQSGAAASRFGKSPRNTALDRYSYNTAQCRSSGFEAVLEELAECVSGVSMEDDLELRQLGESISRYLATVSPTARWVFLRASGEKRADIHTSLMPARFP